MDNPTEIGSDLIVASVAAIHDYGAPLLIVDMGTATTITAIDKDGVYSGGCICPGLKISLEALTGRTAQLPASVWTSRSAPSAKIRATPCAAASCSVRQPCSTACSTAWSRSLGPGNGRGDGRHFQICRAAVPQKAPLRPHPDAQGPEPALSAQCPRLSGAIRRTPSLRRRSCSARFRRPAMSMMRRSSAPARPGCAVPFRGAPGSGPGSRCGRCRTDRPAHPARGGAGALCVTAGEYRLALASGFFPESIRFAPEFPRTPSWPFRLRISCWTTAGCCSGWAGASAACAARPAASAGAGPQLPQGGGHALRNADGRAAGYGAGAAAQGCARGRPERHARPWPARSRGLFRAGPRPVHLRGGSA